jgi:hypothetical protein
VAFPVLLPTGFEVAATGIVSEHDAKNIEHTAQKSNNLFFITIYFFLTHLAFQITPRFLQWDLVSTLTFQ